jgi:hypothetical protein
MRAFDWCQKTQKEKVPLISAKRHHIWKEKMPEYMLHTQ